MIILSEYSMCKLSARKEKGAVLFAVLVLLSMLSFWVSVSVELAQVAWQEVNADWLQLQVGQVALQGIAEAKLQLNSPLLHCRLNDSEEDYRLLPESWWIDKGCSTHLGPYAAYFVVHRLWQSDSEKIDRVISYASIGFLETRLQADFLLQQNSVRQQNFMDLV
jgi:hypothetical protein